jgi:RNA polymerase-binding transcription factor DksA
MASNDRKRGPTARERTAATRRLEQERVRLEEVRRALIEDSAVESERAAFSELSSADQHPADLGSELFEREKDLSVLEGVDAELGEVTSAFERVRDGSYWTCEVCGRPIGAARLDARPTTRRCVDDQAKLESPGGGAATGTLR